LNIAADYRHAFAGGRSRRQRDLRAHQRLFFQPDNLLEQPAFNLVNAMITWATPGERLKFTLWGKNLTNEGGGERRTAFRDRKSGGVSARRERSAFWSARNSDARQQENRMAFLMNAWYAAAWVTRDSG